MPTGARSERSHDDLQAASELTEAYQRIRTEIGKVIIGQERRGRRAADGPVRPRARAARRRAGAGQDPARQHGRADLEPVVPAHPVHARHDAVGHHRHRHPSGRPRDRPAAVHVHRGADLRQHDPGRRDQPHSAQDAGRACWKRCKSGTSRPGARPIPCPTRSSCWRRRTRSSRKGRIRCPRPSSTGSCSTCWCRTRRPTRSWRSSAGRPATRRPSRRSRSRPSRSWRLQHLVRRVPVAEHVFEYARDLVRASRPSEPEATDLVQKVRLVGGRPAGRPILDPGRQDPRGPARPVPRRRSPTSATSPGPSCGTGSSRRSTPRPRGSAPRRSSSTCSRTIPAAPERARRLGSRLEILDRRSWRRDAPGAMKGPIVADAHSKRISTRPPWPGSAGSSCSRGWWSRA